MGFDMSNIWPIVTVIMGLLSTLLARWWKKGKEKIAIACVLTTGANDVALWLKDAMTDDRVTEEEWQIGFPKLLAFVNAAKDLIHDCPSEYQDKVETAAIQADIVKNAQAIDLLKRKLATDEANAALAAKLADMQKYAAEKEKQLEEYLKAKARNEAYWPQRKIQTLQLGIIIVTIIAGAVAVLFFRYAP